jgi:hypothetical protein
MSSEHDTKEIESCQSCPMSTQLSRYEGYASICTHWGSPEGNRVTTYAPPDWCPLRKKPLLLQVIR